MEKGRAVFNRSDVTQTRCRIKRSARHGVQVTIAVVAASASDAAINTVNFKNAWNSHAIAFTYVHQA